MPANASAEKAIVSESVGCGWTVRPMSSASAPISIASATSAIRSPALSTRHQGTVPINLQTRYLAIVERDPGARLAAGVDRAT